MAAAAGTLVRDTEAGVQPGNLTPQAGRDLFSHLQPLLFNPGGPRRITATPIRQVISSHNRGEQLMQTWSPRRGGKRSAGRTPGPRAMARRSAEG
jgi:hypothetical protein